MDLIGRFALAFAVFGPAVVGVIAIVVTLRRFRSGRARLSIPAAILALISWVALCAAATILGMQFAFARAWMWAHSGRDAGRAVSLGDQLVALGIVFGALLLLGSCSALLQRWMRPEAR
ncbi:MAG TPA: hypothetical protein VM733_20480 [Thermoanaerobaculia bacterium]|nr:hypothetical protein [Thermoanaerobaculia bacterium]